MSQLQENAYQQLSRELEDAPLKASPAEAQGLFRDYKGKRYWFCCAACGPLWDADPDKYADAA